MLNIHHFPKDFLWGTATSAYQIEGAYNVDGRTPSIWDTFCHLPGKIKNNHNGDHACQHYKFWKDDLYLMKELGVNSYRFSISWSRIFPEPGSINSKGIDFYNRLIDQLLSQGIQPFVTMYHWDLPQYIQDEGGWASRQTCEIFRDYAMTLVQNFADRVRYWTTLNEPSVVVYAGHFWGIHAPGIKSSSKSMQVLHHLLLAHGLAVQSIRSSFDVQLGIALNISPVFPANPDSDQDQQAAHLYDTFLYKSFLNALFHKKYPSEILMDTIVKNGDMDLIGLPIDYLGINYYTASRIAFDPNVPLLKGRSIKQKANSFSDLWEFYPQGLSIVIERLWKDYGHLPIYILENGTSLPDIQNDQGRIKYLQAHLQEIANCLTKGIEIKGYFVWSLMDNFEWAEGFSRRFGLIHLNFETFERTLKDSANWYASFIKKLN